MSTKQSGCPKHPQTKASLHIYICQSKLKHKCLPLDTLYRGMNFTIAKILFRFIYHHILFLTTFETRAVLGFAEKSLHTKIPSRDKASSKIPPLKNLFQQNAFTGNTFQKTPRLNATQDIIDSPQSMLSYQKTSNHIQVSLLPVSLKEN